MNFYNEFHRRLNDLNIHITDYLLARDMEKNEMIKYLSGAKKEINQPKTGQQQFIDPHNPPLQSNKHLFIFNQNI